MRKGKSLSDFSWRNRSFVLAACLFTIAATFLAGCGTASEQLSKPLSGIATPSASSGNGGVVSLAPQPTLAPTTTPSLKPTFTPGLAPAILGPGSTLPTEAQCAARVKDSSFEPRPENYQANHSVPTAQQIATLASWGPALGQSIQADNLRKQVTGNFTGTTDEILQWVACKWGVDPNLVRAEAVIESYWKQSTEGDYTTDQKLCPPGTWNGQSCYQSYGILQIKYTYFQSAWPMSRSDTAFNAEYVYGIIRACYEGWTTYLNDDTPLPGYPRYHAGDIWGCLGRWFSGGWYNQGAVNYIKKVKTAMTDKTWLQAGF